LYDTQPHYKIEVSKTRFRFDDEAEFALIPNAGVGISYLDKVANIINTKLIYYETFENYEEEVFMMAIDNESPANSLTLMNPNHYQDMITTLELILYKNY
ncbi:247_t:CDS:2, partial [Scutellospora calospora]